MTSKLFIFILLLYIIFETTRKFARFFDVQEHLMYISIVNWTFIKNKTFKGRFEAALICSLITS